MSPTPPQPIEYRDELPSPEDFLRLFAAAGWGTGAGVEEIRRALSVAWHSVVAYAPTATPTAAPTAPASAAGPADADRSTPSPRLVGMGHVISDGVIHALIVDVIVEPEWQGCGVGREIMRRLIARCDEAGIESIQLFAADGKAPFYEKLGFSARPTRAPGMELRPQPE